MRAYWTMRSLLVDTPVVSRSKASTFSPSKRSCAMPVKLGAPPLNITLKRHDRFLLPWGCEIGSNPHPPPKPVTTTRIPTLKRKLPNRRRSLPFRRAKPRKRFRCSMRRNQNPLRRKPWMLRTTRATVILLISSRRLRKVSPTPMKWTSPTWLNWTTRIRTPLSKVTFPRRWCSTMRKKQVLFNPASRTIRKGKGRLIGMMGRRAERSFALFVVQVLFLSLFAGCLEALDTTVDPRATLDAYPTLIQEGDMVTLDARDSSPVEGVITGYSWDFGDGTTAETVIGFTSHTYLAYGQYTVRITVTNDQGGTDDAIATIVVNGAPVIDLSMPTTVRAGDAALLDASSSYDPEGNPLAYSWDLNAREDSDGDGDPTNDADATTDTVLL
ncbi:MAG TPA: PKD domain-containing protein, partial [Candidatus Poseidoniales archaeon]